MARRRRRTTLRRRRIVALGALGVVLLAGAAWALTAIADGADIPRGTSVLGADLGGLDRGEAATVLEAAVMEGSDRTMVTLTIDGAEPVAATASVLGVSVDVDATLAEADDRPPAPLRPLGLVASLLRDRATEPVFTIDVDALRAALGRGGADPATPRIELVDGSFRAVAGAVIPIPDVDALAELLLAAVETDFGRPIEVDVPIAGSVSPDTEAAAVLAAEANELTAAGARVTLQGTAEQFFIDPAALRGFVRLSGAADAAEIVLEDDLVMATLDSLFAGIGSRGRPAVIGVDDEGLVDITEGEPGYECCDLVAPAVLFSGLRAGLDVIELPGEEIPHPRGREWAESLGIDELVGEFTTEFKPGQTRVGNIDRISELTRGVIIEPGDTFSVNDFVGRRTVEKGFVAAGVIYNGVFREDVGGGISQYATTLFNAAFFAGLDFGEYQSHTIYISRYPYGREATLSYPHPDLQIVNITPYPVMIWPTTTDSSITVRLYSTPWVVGEQTGQSRRAEGVACTRVTTERTRTWLDDGHTEFDTVSARYRPEGTNCDGSPTITTTTTTTTVPEATTTTTTTTVPEATT
ncbi:MAG: VanW family protein, partial [Acidimicrobiales bacterium]